MRTNKIIRSYNTLFDVLSQIQSNFFIKIQFLHSFILHYGLKIIGVNYIKFPSLKIRIYDTIYKTRKDTIDFWSVLKNYEKDISEFLYDLPDGRGIFIDIGAHIGRYSVLMSRKNWEVYSFEPMKSTYNQLLDNIKLNNINNNFHGFNSGLGNKSEIKKIYYQSHKTGEASLVYNGKESMCEEVKIERFDNLAKGDFQNKDVILKIDVEGFEHQVIEGLGNLISEVRPLIIMELWHENSKEISDILYELNYIKKGAVYWFPENSPHLKYFEEKYKSF